MLQVARCSCAGHTDNIQNQQVPVVESSRFAEQPFFMQQALRQLEARFDGLLFYDNSTLHQVQLRAYSTDASVYQEQPRAVAIPASVAALRELILFAREQGTTLLPRAAGTSLAGQVVGNGIVVDVSKYFTRILEVNTREKWARVQPGVIRDELNHHLKPLGLMYGPETSTANRAMLGGMLGNNSCGLHSIVWGAARDHVLEVTALLSDGSEAVFRAGELPPTESPLSLKDRIYSGLYTLLQDPRNRELIRSRFPDPQVHRRNTGYALDRLLEMEPFTPGGPPFNLCQLLAGSEGTLALVTEMKVNLLELPPPETAVVCIHCHSIVEAMHANTIALRHRPMAGELVDKRILDFTTGHPEYGQYRSFIEGDPAAILMVEFMEETAAAARQRAEQLVADLQHNGLGFAYPVLYNEASKAAWEVRKAGLGLLRNLKGDVQPVNLIEDCAVRTDDLPMYITDLQALLARHGVDASYYAHAAAGELHVEPLLNLRSPEGRQLFRQLLAETVELVKKYKGSLSGEHGDGRLRGEFIPDMVGPEVYDLFRQVKHLFDPQQVFNAGKITGTPPMDQHLRVPPQPATRQLTTTFDFSEAGGLRRRPKKSSASGDCRKMPVRGGPMSPSYRATRLEKDTTRARANLLRQFLANEADEHPFHHQEIKEVMDLCLSCKGCKTECPSGVDVAKMKAEFLQQYYDRFGVPLRAQLIARFSSQMRLVSRVPWLFNTFYSIVPLRRLAHRLVGFHPHRSMPRVAGTPLRSWFRQHRKETTPAPASNGRVLLFCDEFTNYTDAAIGRQAVLLLEALGYEVVMPEHEESGRTWLSKGLVKQAARIINRNITRLAPLVGAGTPLVGIEPSAILTYRDEANDLALPELREQARQLAQHTFTIEEFLSRESEAGRINRNLFTTEVRQLHVHGHCYQKALSDQRSITNCLSIPTGYRVHLIPSGCCGMAGGFGYEAEHFELSQQVGELVLFPAVRAAAADDLIVAPGTSCRHQVKDGTGRRALHPVEVLYKAMK